MEKTQQSISVHRFDDKKRRIDLSVENIVDIFKDNAILHKFVTDEKLATTYDSEELRPYVQEALVEIIKKAHSLPINMNVYLMNKNKARTLETKWVEKATNEVVKTLLDSAAERLSDLASNDKERSKVPTEFEMAMSKIPGCYREKDDVILKKSTTQLVQHLMNMKKQIKTKNVLPLPLSDKKVVAVPKRASVKKASPEINLAPIRNAVLAFLKTANPSDQWDIAAVNIKKQLPAMPLTDEDINDTIERYLWEFSTDEDSEISLSNKNVAKKLSTQYNTKTT